MLQLARDWGRYLLGIVLLMLLYFKILKPVWARIDASLQPPAPPALENAAEDAEDVVEIQPRGYEHNLNRAKQLARDDPKLVANVVKSWVGTNE